MSLLSICMNLQEKLPNQPAMHPTTQIGDPLAPDCRLGPLVSREQHSKVLAYVESAIAEGAMLLTGGRRPPGFSRGCFVEPTVFTNVQPHMRIWREEIFGPVLAGEEGRGAADACHRVARRGLPSLFTSPVSLAFSPPLQPARSAARPRRWRWPTRLSLGWARASSRRTQSAASESQF